MVCGGDREKIKEKWGRWGGPYLGRVRRQEIAKVTFRGTMEDVQANTISKQGCEFVEE